MMRNDPVKALREEVENIRCGAQPECQHDIVSKADMPHEPEVMPVRGADRNVR